jgi:acetyl esterase/lipase
MTSWLVLRFVIGIVSIVLALPIVISIGSVTGWKMTLLATEYGHRLAVVALLIALVGIAKQGWIARGGSAFLLVAALLWLIPIFQALNLGASLPSQMKSGKDSSVSWRGLWLGNKPQLIKSEEFVYVKEADGERTVSFYRAQGRTEAPCIILLHSGGWETGRAQEFPEWSSYWASKGYAVASVQYRLAPNHQWPAPMEDVKMALAWLKQNASKLGIKGNQFVIIGRSAGAQIATASAYALKDSDIKGCVSLYGPADMFFARKYAYADDALNSLRLLRNYVGDNPEEEKDRYTSASAYLTANAQSCPTLLVHGARDVLVWVKQSQRLDARLSELGVPHYYLELPWGTHALDWPYDGPGAILTRFAIDQFLASVF